MAFQREPWERQQWDTAASWAAFEYYLLQTPPRSIDEAYRRYVRQKYNRSPTRASKTCRQWANGLDTNGHSIEGALTWKDRADKWDEKERTRKRDEWRKKRVELLEGFFGKTVAALQQFRGEDATLGQLTQAVKTAVQELRAEYDDLPTQKQQNLDIDLTQLSDHDLQRIANGEDPVRVLATKSPSGTGEAQAVRDG